MNSEWHVAHRGTSWHIVAPCIAVKSRTAVKALPEYRRYHVCCGCVIGVDVIACHDSVWLVTVQGGVALVVTVIFTTLLIGWECADVQGGLYV